MLYTTLCIPRHVPVYLTYVMYRTILCYVFYLYVTYHAAPYITEPARLVSLLLRGVNRNGQARSVKLESSYEAERQETDVILLVGGSGTGNVT
jgi:hypothetical protein